MFRPFIGSSSGPLEIQNQELSAIIYDPMKGRNMLPWQYKILLYIQGGSNMTWTICV